MKNKKAVSIVTARSNPKLIKDFFDDLDIKIHKDLIYAVNNPKFISKYKNKRTIAELKKAAVEEILAMGFNKIDFYDDDKNNLKTIRELENKYQDIKINTYEVKL